MNAELTSDATEWIEADLSSGRFSTAQEASGHAIDLADPVRLRAEIAAAEAEGGDFSTDDLLRHVRARLDEVFSAHRD